jgi:spermidine synthase
MSQGKKDPVKEFEEIREYHSRSSGIFFEFDRCLCCEQSTYQKIEVINNPHFGHVLFLDGLVQTTEKDEFFYHEMLAHPALVTHPDPQKVLIIGGGDGGVLKEVLRYPIKKAQLVEIDSQVIKVSKKYFPWLRGCLRDSRAEVVIADGKVFLQDSDQTFDVILVDSSEPVGPSVSLHEADFYKTLKSHLAAHGVACTQLGSPFYHLEAISKAKFFLSKLFKTASLYTAPVPTYPGGFWCFSFLSDEGNPLAIKRNPPPALKYFSQDIHKAAFALPLFLKEKLK